MLEKITAKAPSAYSTPMVGTRAAATAAMRRTPPKITKAISAANGEPYTTLSYANGPGYKKQRPNLSLIDTKAPDYQQLGTVPMPAETHAGEDVAAFAAGQNAGAVRGVMEQNRLYDVMYDVLIND